jgi:CubicO group peptidase (beta-lactamase class C family)
LYLWDQAFTAEKLVSKKSLDAMFTASSPSPSGLPSFVRGYGYGWGIGTLDNHRLMVHGGHMPGVSTINGFFPDDHVMIIVLSNHDEADTNNILIKMGTMVFARQ